MPSWPTHRLAARMAALATLRAFRPHTQDRIRNMVNNEGAELLHRLGPLTQCSSIVTMVGDLHDIPAGRSRLGLQRRQCCATSPYFSSIALGRT